MENARTMRWTAALAAALAVAAAAPDTALAQVPALEQGSMLVGGTAGFNVENADGQEESTTSFHLSPTLQYFVAQGSALGGEVQFFDRTSFGPDSDFDVENYGLALGISAFVH